MEEEAPKHLQPGLSPCPPHTPSSLSHTHLPPFEAGGNDNRGGLVEAASSRGQLPAVTHTPPGYPHPALDLDLSKLSGLASPLLASVSLTHGSSDNAGRGRTGRGKAKRSDG